VALGQFGQKTDRQIWALKVGGRTGRMAVGVALNADEVGPAVLLSQLSYLKDISLP